MQLSGIKIIQGGMGVYISTPSLSKKVSILNGLGTVSGTAADRILAIELGRGDVGGHYRRALEHFPFPEIAKRIIDTYFNPEGLGTKTAPVYRVDPSKSAIELIIVANFVFVWLAKEGHRNPVSINYLEKIAIPHVFAITGAMLAGVDVITMGAGLPLHVPGTIDALINDQTAEYPIPVTGSKEPYIMRFNAEKFFGRKIDIGYRPAFIPIISSNLLARICVDRLPSGSFQGFVVEEPTAGGHNAPPRGKGQLDQLGQPVYGEKDRVDYHKLAELGYPFWIGGSYASPEKLAWAREQGACGIQAGSIFALCEESGMNPLLKREVIDQYLHGRLKIRTSPTASPTGFPFKVVVLTDTLSEQDVYERRPRVCNQGALVELYTHSNGQIGYRCAAEPVDTYKQKGGKTEDANCARCICNGLIATAGIHPNEKEPTIVTLGDNLGFLNHLVKKVGDNYSIEDAMNYLLGLPR